jgi:hypothetical protein
VAKYNKLYQLAQTKTDLFSWFSFQNLAGPSLGLLETVEAPFSKKLALVDIPRNA